MDIKEKQLINGKEVSIIATYRDDEFSKDYIIYTDESKSEAGKLNVTYGYYEMKNDEIIVRRIENYEEEKKILEILKEVTKAS